MLLVKVNSSQNLNRDALFSMIQIRENDAFL